MSTYDACSFSVPALASGGAQSIATNTTGYSGSATASCTNGTVTLAATAASCTKTGPSDADLALQTSVAPLTYAADAPERIVVEHLNKQRAQCGFGLLAQSAALDRAAFGHARYVLNRMEASMAEFEAYLANPHIEAPGLSGFVAANHQQRISAAGYANPASGKESSTHPSWGNGTFSPQGVAIGGIMGLLGTVYHMGTLMSESRDIGVGLAYNADIAWIKGDFKEGGGASLVINQGYLSHPQRQAKVLSYPCEGSVDTEFDFGAEIPNPMVNSGIPRPWGQPIYFQAPRGATTLTLNSISIEPVNAPAGTPSYSTAGASVFVLSRSNDPHGLVRSDQVYAVPHRPLLASTSYRVRVNLTVDGVSASQDFTFATGIGSSATKRRHIVS